MVISTKDGTQLKKMQAKIEKERRRLQESEGEIEADEGHGFEESVASVDLPSEIPRVGNNRSRFVDEKRMLLSFERGTCGRTRPVRAENRDTTLAWHSLHASA